MSHTINLLLKLCFLHNEVPLNTNLHHEHLEMVEEISTTKRTDSLTLQQRTVREILCGTSTNHATYHHSPNPPHSHIPPITLATDLHLRSSSTQRHPNSLPTSTIKYLNPHNPPPSPSRLLLPLRHRQTQTSNPGMRDCTPLVQ